MESTPTRSCALVMALMLAWSPALAQHSQTTLAPGATAGNPPAKTFSQQDLDRLLAPIALYPDPLLAQVLMASTYPLEVVQAARWVKANPKVSGAALETAMAKQSWDPAVKSLTAVPQVVQQMSDNLDWMQKLGDAFLAQQQDVMDTVQGLRARADTTGNLKTTEQQVVRTEVQGSQKIYVVESPKPEVVYVPTYNPTVVYGSWWYPDAAVLRLPAGLRLSAWPRLRHRRGRRRSDLGGLQLGMGSRQRRYQRQSLQLVQSHQYQQQPLEPQRRSPRGSRLPGSECRSPVQPWRQRAGCPGPRAVSWPRRCRALGTQGHGPAAS
jgi:hypothetical protein